MDQQREQQQHQQQELLNNMEKENLTNRTMPANQPGLGVPGLGIPGFGVPARNKPGLANKLAGPPPGLSGRGCT